MTKIFLTKDDEARLADLFEKLLERRSAAESCEVGSKERAMAWREVAVIMRQIVEIIPLATEPWS
jgi:hypothetical protein